MVTEVTVAELLDTPAGRDEHGVDDVDLEECTCGVLFRRGGAHRCGHVGEWVTWSRYEARQEVK